MGLLCWHLLPVAAVPHPSGIPPIPLSGEPTVSGLSSLCPAVLPSSRPCSPQSSAGTSLACHPAPLHAALGTLPSWALAELSEHPSPCWQGHGHCWQPLSRGCIGHFYGRAGEKRRARPAHLVYILVQQHPERDEREIPAHTRG